MKDLMGMMKQVGEMQARVQQMQEELAALEIDGQSGGGLVKVTLTRQGRPEEGQHRSEPREAGRGRDPRGSDRRRHAPTPNRKLDAKLQAKMQEVTGGLPLPPGLKLF